MSIELSNQSIKGFFKLIDTNNDRNVNSQELADGINRYILDPLYEKIPVLDDIPDILPLVPENLQVYSNEGSGNFDESEVTRALEAYIDFISSKIMVYYEDDVKITLQNWFNTTFSRIDLSIDTIDNSEPMDIDVDQIHENPNAPEENFVQYTQEHEPGNTPIQAQQLSLEQIYRQITVFDPLSPFGDEPTAFDFFEDQRDYNPFIIRKGTKFSGNAIDWPSNKVFIECVDDAPESWQGTMAYRNLVKSGGRIFIKISLFGSLILIIKPNWWDNGNIPGTGFFNIVPAGNVNKFMIIAFANGDPGEEVLGADHCNQKTPQIVYELQEMTLDELNSVAAAAAAVPQETGGRLKSRRIKHKKYSLRKMKRKSKKHVKKNKKTKNKRKHNKKSSKK